MTLNPATKGACKVQAAFLIGLYQTIVGVDKAKSAAIICVEQMKKQYETLFERWIPPPGEDEEAKRLTEMEWEKDIAIFDEVIRGIRAF